MPATLIPGPEYIVTTIMNERLFIMVCRHFAYAGTIDKLLSFQEEFEMILIDVTHYSRVLFDKLHGLLIPFRVGRLPAQEHYDPNEPDLFAEDTTRTYLQRMNRVQRRISLIKQRIQPRSNNPSLMMESTHFPCSSPTTLDHTYLSLFPTCEISFSITISLIVCKSMNNGQTRPHNSSTIKSCLLPCTSSILTS